MKKLGTKTDCPLEKFVTNAGTVYVAEGVEAVVVWLGLTVMLSGFTPVALPSKYHPPMSVNTP